MLGVKFGAIRAADMTGPRSIFVIRVTESSFTVSRHSSTTKMFVRM